MDQTTADSSWKPSDDLIIFVFDIGFTTSRPIVVDECFSRVTVLAHTLVEARQIALGLASCRPQVQMPTSDELIRVAI